MKVDQIIVIKETRDNEARVALTPSAAASLVAKHYSIMIESEAGILAGFKDEDYIQAGVRIFKLSETSFFPPHTLLLRVKRPQ
jgi:NAD/NADP transhydrogenase alpha subunit